MSRRVKFIIILSVLNSIIFAQVLFEEGFVGGNQPTGWSFSGNWQVDSSGYDGHQVGNPPPGAFFYWNPAQSNYSFRMTTPNISVGNAEQVKVFFDMELDFYAANPNADEGLAIEYRVAGSNNWLEVLNYRVEPGVYADFPLSTQSFLASVSDSIQLGFRAYGLNSYYINSWDIDNVKVVMLPQLNSVNISSNNALNSGQAGTGDVITLTFTSGTALSEALVIIGNTEITPTDNGNGLEWSVSYTVQETDQEGPISFVIIFKDQSDIDGAPISSTTDGSLVIVDRSGPGDFTVGNVTVTGGVVQGAIWNSTNTALEIEIPLPPDSAVTSFNYTPGNALNYDGLDDNVLISSTEAIQPSNSITVELWLKPDSYSDYEGFLHNVYDQGGSKSGYGWVYFGSGWHFFLETNNYTQTEYNNYPVVSTQIDVWTHIAAVYDGSEVKLYKDGVLASSAVVTGNIDYSNAPVNMTIGSFSRNGSEAFFDGSIDELRIWSVARTSAQIQGYMNSYISGSESGLVGYWSFDEGSGSLTADKTINTNSGTINGATWSIGDSPVNFVEDQYDYTTLAGAYIQITGSVDGNEFSDIGGLDTISLENVNAGTSTALVSENEIESLFGFANSTTVTIGAKILDNAGNASTGSSSGTTIFLEYIAEEPSTLSIISNNAISNFARTGDQVILDFTSGEEIVSSTVTIADQYAVVTNIADNAHRGTITLNGSEADGNVTYSISYVDTYNNTYTDSPITTDGSAVVIDNTSPLLNTVSIESNNAWDSNWAKAGDIITVSAASNENLLSKSGTIATQDGTVNNVNSTDFNLSYTMLETDPEGSVSFELFFSDSAGNEGNTISSTTDNSEVIYDITPPVDFTVGTVIATGPIVVENIWNSNNTGLNVAIPIPDDASMYNGQAQVWAKVGNNSYETLGMWEYTYSSEFGFTKTMSFSANQVEAITGFNEGGSISIKAVLSDRPGNETEGSASANVLLIDQTLPVLNPISIYSSNVNTAVSLPGDTVFVTFTATEIIDTIYSTIGTFEIDGISSDNLDYKIWRIMTGEEPEGIIAISVVAGDSARNLTNELTETSDGSFVNNATGPEIQSVTIKSNNTYGDTLAKIADVISVTISSNMQIYFNDSYINGKIANETDIGGNQYELSIVTQVNDPEGIMGFNVDYTDINNNEYDDITSTSDNSYVRYDGTIPTSVYASIASNNTDSTLAIVGDVITVHFNLSELCQNISVSILNQPINLESLGDNYYRAQYTLEGNETEGLVSFSVNYEDVVGNVGNTTETTNNSSVIYDLNPPADFTLGNVIASGGDVYAGFWNSTNQNVIVNIPIDLDSSLVQGNIIVLVSFDEGAFNQIGDQTTLISENINTMLQLSFSENEFLNFDDFSEGGIAQFNAIISDVAGNPKIGTASNDILLIDEIIPVLTGIEIISDNDYGYYATIEDQIHVSMTIDENFRHTYMIINSDSVDVLQNTDNWFGSMTVESDAIEGSVIFEITIVDSAGNSSIAYSETTNGSLVIIDVTKPEVNSLIEGSVDEDQDFINDNSTLWLKWYGSDALSGLKSYKYSIGTSAGSDDFLNWTELMENNQVLIENITLQESINYIGNVFAVDSAGNISDTLSGDGFVVDITQPEDGNVFDGFDLENEVDWALDSTFLDIRWRDFSDNIGINYFEVCIGTSFGGQEVSDWQVVSAELDSFKFTNLSLQSDITFYCSVRAIDFASNTSNISTTDGIVFDNSPVSIVQINPELSEYIGVSDNEEISIHFNKEVVSYNVSIISELLDTLTFDHLYEDNVLTLTLDSTLFTSDVIRIVLNDVTSMNELTKNDSFEFYSTFWGDLNQDFTLDVLDVVEFNTTWPDLDLAPMFGSIPHMKPNLDGEANLRDMAVFAQMWTWYYKLNPKLPIYSSLQSIYLKNEIINQNLIIHIAENISAGEILFDYSNSISDIKLSANSTADRMVLSAFDNSNLLQTFAFANLNEKADSTIQFHITSSNRDPILIQSSFRFFNKNGVEVTSGKYLFNILPLPKEYKLYANFPNPFNMRTTIQFDIPFNTKVGLIIYDINGKEVRTLLNREISAGFHNVQWDGFDNQGKMTSSGIYFARLQSSSFQKSNKILLLK